MSGSASRSRSRSRSPRPRSGSRSRSPAPVAAPAAKSRSRSPRSRSRSPPPRRGGGGGGGDNKRVYVGKLSHRTRERDLEDVFGKFGRIHSIDLKDGYGFVEFEDATSAADAIKDLDNTDLDGSVIRVEPSHRGEGRCFTCGKEGHWAVTAVTDQGRPQCARPPLLLGSVRVFLLLSLAAALPECAEGVQSHKQTCVVMNDSEDSQRPSALDGRSVPPSPLPPP
eukprot:CAMPEP_0177681282 /NCGR_PEP_ID=MMETSP0447-20121125/30628_1 /TAXON_ID=0 /ORGANISM="Stygamoeba regulata, Strain BSH-02190019" /LENGTH=223 /DNA_ID=CAMNT_0019190679 /DNA_START=48 /DNA_END=716 /DNA_ORIENTATION=-